MKKNKHVLCRGVEIILLSAISQAGGEGVGIRGGDESRSWPIREQEGNPWGGTNVGTRKTRGNQSGLDACM